MVYLLIAILLYYCDLKFKFQNVGRTKKKLRGPWVGPPVLEDNIIDWCNRVQQLEAISLFITIILM